MAVKRTTTVLGYTRGGKEIQAVPVGMRALFEVQFGDGGQVPKMLQGVFSDRAAVAAKVEEYLSTEPTPRKKRTKRS